MYDLDEILYRFLFGNVLLFLNVGPKVSLVTELQNEVNVIDCFFNIDETYDVVILTGFEDLYFVVEELCELA